MNRVAQGHACVSEIAPGHWRLQVDGTAQQYSNAQLDDYHHLPRRAFPWHPPVQLSLWAKVPAAHHGTWGFGWWNAPYSPLTSAMPARPASAWFFGNGKGNMAWSPQSATTGFKAATLETRTWQSLIIAPFTPLIMLVNRHPHIYRWLWTRLMPYLQLTETMIAMPDDAWHHYHIDWQIDSVTWAIDGIVIAHTPFAPRGVLGLCIWIDNQWLTATPDGQFGWGLTDATGTLEIRDLTITDPHHDASSSNTPYQVPPQ
jgi:hypothetical protein